MSDGQDKSDDLIAELAKLMASSAGGAEPEAKAGPILVSAPTPAAAEPRPVGPTIRIPGMDTPVAAAPQPAPAPTPVIPVPQAATPAPAPTIRIPGMDQPVAAAPRPVAPPPVAAMPAPPKPVEHRAPSIDFGTLPPAATIRPEPMSNWQDREIPKPVAARPSVAAEPVLTAPAPKPVAPPAAPPIRMPAPAPASTAPAVQAPVPVPVKLDTPVAPKLEDEPVIAGKPAPAGDSFDFDFGFGDNPPDTVEAESRAAAPAPRVPIVSTGDPIADLIAAELDAAVEEEPSAVPARPPVQPPAIRSFPAAPPAVAVQPQQPQPQQQPQQQLQPQQQRAVTTNPVRPPVAPPAAVVPQPKPAAEPDRFAAAPVFGVGRPAAPAPVERDPMDEIESLIGEAVRVELSASEPPVAAERPRQSAPVVPPLTTGFAPRRAAIKDTEPQIASAEAAILAAAAASGADVGRLDGQMAAEASASPYKRPKAKPEKRSVLSGGMRQYVGMAVAGTLLLAAGFGLYWVLGMGRGPDTAAPVLQADSTPVKEPAPVSAPKGDAEGSVVFNSVGGGGNGTPPADEQIVSTDASVDTPVTDIAETVGAGADGTDATAAADGSESELANRKVRTVTVRPDGTIVSGDEAGGGGALPVDRPNVPDIPGAEVEPSPLLADTPAADAPVDPTALAVADPTAALTATPSDPANIDPSVVAPVPMGRPKDRSVLGGGSNQRVAATNTDSGPVDLTGGDTAVAAPSAPAVSTAGGAYVQLSSQPTSADAQASLRTTQNRLSGVLNGRSLEVRQVDLGAKGIWYRVVLPTNSFSEATQTCANLKANGTQCVAING